MKNYLRLVLLVSTFFSGMKIKGAETTPVMEVPTTRIGFPNPKPQEVWDLSHLPQPTEWILGKMPVYGLAASSDGRILVGVADQEYTVWKPQGGNPVSGKFGRGPFVYPTLWPPCIFFRKSEPFGVLLETSASTQSDSSELECRLKIMELKTGKTFSETTLPFPISDRLLDGLLTLTPRNGERFVIAFRSPLTRFIGDPAALKGNREFKESDFEKISALQVFDRELKVIGKGCPAHLNVGVKLAAFSEQGTKIATLDEQGVLRAFDTDTQRQIIPKEIVNKEVGGLAITGGGLIVAGTSLGSLECYDASTGKEQASVDLAHHKPIKLVAVSPNGKVAVSAANDNFLKLWSLPELKAIGFIDGGSVDGEDSFSRLLFMDDQNLAASLNNGAVRTWKTDEARDCFRWNPYSAPSRALSIAVSKDGSRIAIDDGGVLRLIDGNSHKEIKAVPAHSGGVFTIEFEADSKRIITSGADGTEKVWDLEKNTDPVSVKPKSTPFPFVENPPFKVKAYGDSPQFAIGCDLPDQKCIALRGLGKIWIYSQDTQALVWGYATPSMAGAIAYDATRQELLCGHWDGVVRIWKVPKFK